MQPADRPQRTLVAVSTGQRRQVTQIEAPDLKHHPRRPRQRCGRRRRGVASAGPGGRCRGRIPAPSRQLPRPPEPIPSCGQPRAGCPRAGGRGTRAPVTARQENPPAGPLVGPGPPPRSAPGSRSAADCRRPHHATTPHATPTQAVAAGRLSPETLTSYAHEVRLHITSHLGSLRMGEITPPVLRAWIVTLLDKPRGPAAPACAGTATAQSAPAFAADRGLHARCPAGGAQRRATRRGAEAAAQRRQARPPAVERAEQRAAARAQGDGGAPAGGRCG